MIGAVSSRVSSSTIIGRDAESERLHEGYRRVATEGSATIVVAGEAGVGKTRLIDALGEHVDASGGAVVAGACLDLGDHGIPFAPLVDGLRAMDRARPDELERAVAAGGSAIDPRVVERLAAARFDRGSLIDWLTPRERAVLEAMAAGMSNSGIADHLGIGVRSVEKHVNAIFAKLGLVEEDHVHRRVHAVLTFLSEVG